MIDPWSALNGPIIQSDESQRSINAATEIVLLVRLALDCSLSNLPSVNQVFCITVGFKQLPNLVGSKLDQPTITVGVCIDQRRILERLFIDARK